VFLATCFKYCSQGLPSACFLYIAPSRMFTTNSLCLIVCPIHEWRLFFKIFKSNLRSFGLWKTSSFVILSAHFIFNIPLQHHVSNVFMIVSFFPTVCVSDPQTAALQVQLSICLSYISKLRLFEHSICFLLLNITLASSTHCIMSSLFFPSSVNTICCKITVFTIAIDITILFVCAFGVIVNSCYWHFISSWIKTGILHWQQILMFGCLQWCQLVTKVDTATLLICMLHSLWTIPNLFACWQTVESTDCVQTHNIFSCKIQNE